LCTTTSIHRLVALRLKTMHNLVDKADNLALLEMCFDDADVPSDVESVRAFARRLCGVSTLTHLHLMSGEDEWLSELCEHLPSMRLRSLFSWLPTSDRVAEQLFRVADATTSLERIQWYASVRVSSAEASRRWTAFCHSATATRLQLLRSCGFRVELNDTACAAFCNMLASSTSLIELEGYGHSRLCRW
jgi:hypothetical protein